jgi:2-iminobutanoate/2-iminopropanoate deaminase
MTATDSELGEETTMWHAIDAPHGPPLGGAYSPAVRAGDFVFVAGQSPKDPQTGEYSTGPIGEQVHLTFANVERVLSAVDLGLEDVVRVDAFLRDVGDFAAYDRAYREIFTGQLPTRTTIGVELTDADIEVTVVAYAGD